MTFSFEDLIDYSAGMNRLKRFRPRARTLLILAAWGVAAWYWHIALVLLACMALFMADVSGDLTAALVVDGEHIRRQSAERIEDMKSELRELRAQVEKLSGELTELRSWTNNECEPEHLRQDLEAIRCDIEGLQNNIGTMPSEWDSVQLDIIGKVQELDELSHGLSAELRILRDAIDGIDPKAIRSMDAITEWADHARERYEDHTRGVSSPYDRSEHSIARLQREVDELKRRLGDGSSSA